MMVRLIWGGAIFQGLITLLDSASTKVVCGIVLKRLAQEKSTTLPKISPHKIS